MDRDQLKRYLDRGLSLEEIGRMESRHPSTVGYWVKKLGLVANGRSRYAARGPLDRDELVALIEAGATHEELARAFDRSIASVRHWMKRYGLRTNNTGGRRSRGGKEKPILIVDDCPRHGVAEFVLEARGAYRCKRCRCEAVQRWRRNKKLRLIEEAGGACALCGYDRHPGSLQFHHLDPGTKQFNISRQGMTRSYAECRDEAAKCVLLCANCHGEVEAGVASLPSAGDLGLAA
jgi:hypothetical protein